MDETESGSVAMFDHHGWSDSWLDSPLYGNEVTCMYYGWNSWNQIMDDGDDYDDYDDDVDGDDDDDDVDGEMDETESGPTAWCWRRERPN